MAQIAALFDLDGTLYTGHIWQDLVRHHRATKRHRGWVAAYVVRNMALYPLYKLGLMDQTTFYGAWSETMGWLLRGWSVDEAQSLFGRLTDEQILPNLRSITLARLAEHQQAGHLVALVSGTFAPWLEVVAHKMGPHGMGALHAIGTPLEVRDGRYTGRILPPLCQGPGKPARACEYFARKGMEVDWAGSYAYADSGTDLPLFHQVGHPVAVYPDKILAGRAQAENWPVIGGAGV